MFSCCACEPQEDEIKVGGPDPTDYYESAPEADAARPWTQEEKQKEEERKQKEKERLAILVKSFANEAFDGVACTFFDHTTGEKVPSEYKLDKAIKWFHVTVPNVKSFSFEVKRLQEVYSWEFMERTPKMANFMKSRAFCNLTNDEKSKLVMLEYIDKKEYLQRACIFLDPDPEAADDFINCIKILRLFSVTPTSPR